MLHRSRMLAAGTHLPLQKLALCLACGSSTWSPLARFFELASGSRAHCAGGSARRMLRRRTAEEMAIAKHLLLVAQHRRELYEQVKRAFAGHETVQVILDRRVSERRQRKGAPMLDRRRHDRRSRSAIDEQLRTIGWSLVLLDLAKSKRS